MGDIPGTRGLKCCLTCKKAILSSDRHSKHIRYLGESHVPQKLLLLLSLQIQGIEELGKQAAAIMMEHSFCPASEPGQENHPVHQFPGVSSSTLTLAQHSSGKGKASETSCKGPKQRSSNSPLKEPTSKRPHSLTRSTASEILSSRLAIIETKVSSSTGEVGKSTCLK